MGGGVDRAEENRKSKDERERDTDEVVRKWEREALERRRGIRYPKGGGWRTGVADGGARNVQRGDRRWSRLAGVAGSLVDPAASSARRDVTMAIVVIAVRCDTMIS